MRSLLFSAVLMLALPVSAVAQLSPGPLSRSHADLDGTLQCARCHAIGLGRQQLKCSSCHVEILDRVKNKRGFHAQVVDSSKGDEDCVTCHKEHVSRDFELIRWPPPGQSGFDHARAGFRLEGKHGALQCSQCHNSRNISPARRQGILLKNFDRTFLGLGTDCLSCHADTHRGQLSSTCTSCHSQDAWKPANQFDHRRTRFPLTGLHAAVSCERCHSQTGGAAHFKVMNFADCTGCHRDPHRAAFGATCTQCHSTAGWRVPKTRLTSRFDHSKTRYPLTGKHKGLDCGSCHKTSDFSVKIAAGKCVDCHADKHQGQFAQRADKGDCGACHSVGGFERSTFDLKAHTSTRYPLLGKHTAVACGGCHETKARVTNYHPDFQFCADCHQDVHAGQFLARFQGNCESCHAVEGFKPSTFTLVGHKQTRFDLSGAHAAVPCIECHKKDAGSASHRYVFEERSCVACHRDPHEFRVSQKQECETCHTLTTWIPALKFDHGNTRFPLLGSHRAVDCLSCHKPKVSGTEKHVRFVDAPQQCSGCHDDIHAGQFAGRIGSEDCSGCHATLTWKPARGFDHSKSAFPLDGAHRNVRCLLCHSTRSRVNGRETTVYRDAPTECAKCH